MKILDLSVVLFLHFEYYFRLLSNWVIFMEITSQVFQRKSFGVPGARVFTHLPDALPANSVKALKGYFSSL